MRKNRSRIPAAAAAGAVSALIVLCGFFFLGAEPIGQISTGPRQTGEEVLREIILGPKSFIACVESNGCTDKSSFKVEVKTVTGLSPAAPHHVLTIKRIRPDECKAIVEEGTLVMFDLVQDLGLKGNYTYALANRVMSPSQVDESDESLMSIIKKYFTPADGGPAKGMSD